MDTILSTDETALPRGLSQENPDETILYSASDQVEMAEVGTIFSGMTMSLLMGMAIWLMIIIAVVAIF